jgi:threonine dehydratase
VGAEVFRLCNELVDDIVVVTDDEICAAVRDAFEDTRAVLEPAGAIAIAGLKKYVDAMAVPPKGASRGNFVAISSDASNIEFDILRFIAERAAIGEQRSVAADRTRELTTC